MPVTQPLEDEFVAPTGKLLFRGYWRRRLANSKQRRRQEDEKETITGCLDRLSGCLRHPGHMTLLVSCFDLRMRVMLIQVFHTVSGGQEE